MNDNASPVEMAELMLRPRSRVLAERVRIHHKAIRQAAKFAESNNTVRGRDFWTAVLNILTRRRLFTKCPRGHVLTLERLMVTHNGRSVILKCLSCNAAAPSRQGPYRNRRYPQVVNPEYRRAQYLKHRDKNRAAMRAYYQKNRERMLAKANARNARMRAVEAGRHIMEQHREALDYLAGK